MIEKALVWLIGLAERKPLLFCLAFTLVFLAIGGYVVNYQQKRIERLEVTNRELQVSTSRRVDSLSTVYSLKSDKLEADKEATLRMMLEDYKTQLNEQRNLNRKIDNTLINNEKVLKANKEKLKKLNNDY